VIFRSRASTGASLRPRCFGAKPASSPRPRARRHTTRCEEYNPSRRSTAPTAPGVVQASASFRMRSLYSAAAPLLPPARPPPLPSPARPWGHPVSPSAVIPRGGTGRVEDARDGVQDRRRLLRAAPFVAALAEKSIAPSRASAHRTGRDHFGHPALGRVSRAAFAGIPLGRHVQRPLEPPEFRGGCQAHADPPLGSSKRTPNQGPFPPLALPSFLGTMGPSDACLARPPKRPVPGRPGRATGLPCCQSPRAYVLRPLPRRAERSSCIGRSDRPRWPSSNADLLTCRVRREVSAYSWRVAAA
jgi:hypothetical protein